MLVLGIWASQISIGFLTSRNASFSGEWGFQICAWASWCKSLSVELHWCMVASLCKFFFFCWIGLPKLCIGFLIIMLPSLVDGLEIDVSASWCKSFMLSVGIWVSQMSCCFFMEVLLFLVNWASYTVYWLPDYIYIVPSNVDGLPIGNLCIGFLMQELHVSTWHMSFPDVCWLPCRNASFSGELSS